MEGLTKKEIYTRLNANPDDILVNSMYEVLWRNGTKPYREHITIKKNEKQISFLKRNITPDLIDFNLIVKIPIDMLFGEMYIDKNPIPPGETIIIPTQIVAEDINMTFNESNFHVLMEWCRAFTATYSFKKMFNKMDVVDNIALYVHGRQFVFHNVMPTSFTSFEYSDDNKTCNVSFNCDYTTIEL